MNYSISEIYPSIQGEGAMAGTPCTVLRLQGCTVGCTWCDTKHAWGCVPASLEEGAIVERWKGVRESSDWILLTGGEPTEQQLMPLANMLVAFGARLMLETSGTGSGADDAYHLFEHITLSPKAHALPRAEVCRYAHSIKIIVDTEETVQHWWQWVTDVSNPVRRKVLAGMPVFVQPMSGKASALQVAMAASRRYGWRLSLQTHKLLGIP